MKGKEGRHPETIPGLHTNLYTYAYISVPSANTLAWITHTHTHFRFQLHSSKLQLVSNMCYKLIDNVSA